MVKPKHTKEEYEELLNNSSLFDVNKEDNSVEYKKLSRQFLSDICDYYFYYVCGGKQKALDVYDEAVVKTTTACLKSYDKSKGSFINYFNHSMKVAAKRAVAEERAFETYGGTVKKDSTYLSLLSKVKKYARENYIDLNAPYAVEEIARGMKVKVNDVKRAIELDNVHVQQTSASDDDEDETDFFERVSSDERSAEDNIVKYETLVEYIDIIDRLYRKLQNRPSQLEIVSKMLTISYTKVIMACNDIKIGRLVAGKSFFDSDFASEILNCGKEYTQVEIAEIVGVMPESFSRTWNNFTEKLGRIIFSQQKNFKEK